MKLKKELSKDGTFRMGLKALGPLPRKISGQDSLFFHHWCLDWAKLGKQTPLQNSVWLPRAWCVLSRPRSEQSGVGRVCSDRSWIFLHQKTVLYPWYSGFRLDLEALYREHLLFPLNDVCPTDVTFVTHRSCSGRGFAPIWAQSFTGSCFPFSRVMAAGRSKHLPCGCRRQCDWLVQIYSTGSLSIMLSLPELTSCG